jgi:soluble lytic murein transglycosylase-like protein
MRPRLILLLLLTIALGLTAGWVGSATAGKPGRAAFTPPKVVFGRCPIPAQFRRAFVYASQQSRLPLALLTAVAAVESEFQPDARSAAGAHGLLQILPSTAEDLNVDASTPANNVLAGARYLRMMLDQFKSTELALAAYNAGPTAVEQAGGRAPNDESVAYVREVTRLWRSYNGCK